MLSQLEARIGYTFKDKTLLENALTHSSYANENRDLPYASNERLEFLGDSVLGFAVADYLYHRYPDKQEGELTRIRADLVCEKSLAQVARQIGLGEYLRLGHGEEPEGRTRASTISDAVEAVLAAAYLDGGFEVARGIIHRLLLGGIQTGQHKDFKTLFQELVQRKRGQTIGYVMTGETGPDHDKQFTADVLLNGEVVGSGAGRSKKAAEQAAAHVAILKLFPNETV
jgi:ribonuclease-3